MKTLKKNLAVIGTALLCAAALLAAYALVVRHAHRGAEDAVRPHPQNKEIIAAALRLVKVTVTPRFDFHFDLMKPGVIQHLDRDYTYDVIPPDMMNGFLFQGIHRPPKGTAIQFELAAPAQVYFFFSSERHGGYPAIFAGLEGWRRCEVYPQYDVKNGTHGLKMEMYRLDAGAGVYSIPPTTEDRACFNIVFQPSP